MSRHFPSNQKCFQCIFLSIFLPLSTHDGENYDDGDVEDDNIDIVVFVVVVVVFRFLVSMSSHFPAFCYSTLMVAVYSNCVDLRLAL